MEEGSREYEKAFPRSGKHHKMLCVCCGGGDFSSTPVLWPELIAEWRLSPAEVAYIDRQQGTRCSECSSNLRTMALALGILQAQTFRGLFRDWVRAETTRQLRILEINEAGQLTQFLLGLPGHELVAYPDVDMTALPFPDCAFDLVIHSDTLEHVSEPVKALAECRRVLRRGGVCAFTVPLITDRLTISRTGLLPSYHGSCAKPLDCLVHTEYGADAWKHVIEAGFEECRISVLEYPTALALIGVRTPTPSAVRESGRLREFPHANVTRKKKSLFLAFVNRVRISLSSVHKRLGADNS